jgi:DUF4097 and DUF4098 domain-containing protein YvlB
MKEEVQRISRLVAEGKLSPEDAADLIDAFYASERGVDAGEEGRQTPPPPPPGTPGTHFGDSIREPLKGLLDSVEKLTKEGIDSVNWQEVSRAARTSAKKSVDSIKAGIDDLSKGKVNLGWFSSSESRTIEMSLVVPEGKALKIENPCGNVKVTGGFDVGSVKANAHFRGANIEESRAKAAEYVLIVEESDHVVVIRQPDVTGLSVDLDIQLATVAPIEMRVSSGNVEVYDTGAGCRIASRSGNVELHGLNGVIEVGSESGNVEIDKCDSPQVTIEAKSGNLELNQVFGNINARTASGNVSVKKGSGKIVAIESVSGDAEFDSAEPITGTLNVRTVSGTIEVNIADGSDCRVHLSTMRGSVECNVPLEDEARAEQRVTGKLGSGLGTIDVSAITGDVQLNLRDSLS